MRFLSVADVYVMSFMPPLHRFRYGCRTRNLFREGDKDTGEGEWGCWGTWRMTLPMLMLMPMMMMMIGIIACAVNVIFQLISHVRGQ